MMPLLLLALLKAPMDTTIDIVDSRDDASISYVIINDRCKVKVKKTDFKDWDAVVAKVEKQCGLVVHSL